MDDVWAAVGETGGASWSRQRQSPRKVLGQEELGVSEGQDGGRRCCGTQVLCEASKVGQAQS